MNKPVINMTEAISIAVFDAGIENDSPCCVRAIYEEDFFVLTVCTDFMKYEIYVHGFSGEVSGLLSEPLPCTEEELCRICA